MAFTGNDGQRLNVKMSDWIRSTTDAGGGSGLNSSTATSSITMSSNYGLANGIGLSNLYGKNAYNDMDGDGSDAGYYNVWNNNHLVRNVGGISVIEGARFTHMQGRYRSATGAPSNQTVPLEGSGQPIAMSNLVGISCSTLTTDPCGQTRGVKGGYTSGTATKTIYGIHQPASSAPAAKTLKPGIFVDGSIAGVGPSAASSDLIDNATNIGYSAYITSHTNQWTHLGLNTKLCTGDRVIVVAHGGGGTMYTFSSTGPIYLRSGTGGGTSVSATVTTLAAPHKNQTGTDDNVAVYSAVCNADGATMVGVNPFHSSAQPYIFHVYCIKGPNTSAAVLSGYVDKYTNYETSTTDSNGATYGFTTKQAYYIGLSTSPFTYNTQSYPTTLSNTEGYDSVYVAEAWSGGTAGAGMSTVCTYTGGVKGTQTTDKYGFTYSSPLTGFYVPQYGRRIPAKDGRFIQIYGTRGQ